MRRLFLLLVSIAVCALTVGSPAASQDIDPKTKIPFFNQMAQKAAEQGSVRVIVKLAVPDIKTYRAASARFKTGRCNAAALVRAKAADKALASRIAATADDLIGRTGLRGVQVKRRYSAFPLLALNVSPEALNALARDPQVLKITEDRLNKPMLNNTVRNIGASDTWNLNGTGYTGEGWYVAILDTGIEPEHEFFRGKDIIEACFASGQDKDDLEGDCPNGETSMIDNPDTPADNNDHRAAHHSSEYYGWDHGTHVAGIAAGNDVDKPLYGVAKDAGIIAVQISSKTDSAKECSPFTRCVTSWDSDIIAGLNYVYSLRNNRIAAVNISLGRGSYTDACDELPFLDVINQLREAGIATVAASGNEYNCGDPDTGGISAPACISSAIAVGATTDDDEMTYFSNYHKDLLDLFAPGYDVLSAVGDPDSDNKYTNYDSISGTSMSAPHVAGAFALLRQAEFENAPPETDLKPVADLLTALRSSGVSVTGSDTCGTGGIVLPVPRIKIDDALSVVLDNLADTNDIPAAPTDLTAIAADSDRINLKWADNSINEHGFKIERKACDGGEYEEIAKVGIHVTSYSDLPDPDSEPTDDPSPLSELTCYWYRVRAYNDYADESDNYTNEAKATTLLASPGNFNATAESASRIDLSWTNHSAFASGFEIERRSGSGSYTQIAVLGADIENFSDTGLSPATTYYYRIRSIDGSNVSVYAQADARTSSGGGSGGGCFISTIGQ